MKEWNEERLQRAGIVPKRRVTTEHGDVLIGERLMPGSMGTAAETYWFWRQGKALAGRKVEMPVFLPDGRLVPYEEREKIALENALECIPMLANGAETAREVRAKETENLRADGT